MKAEFFKSAVHIYLSEATKRQQRLVYNRYIEYIYGEISLSTKQESNCLIISFEYRTKVRQNTLQAHFIQNEDFTFRELIQIGSPVSSTAKRGLIDPLIDEQWCLNGTPLPKGRLVSDPFHTHFVHHYYKMP